jgi:hypothetical protein
MLCELGNALAYGTVRSRSYTIRTIRCMGRKGPIHRVARVVPTCL